MKIAHCSWVCNRSRKIKRSNLRKSCCIKRTWTQAVNETTSFGPPIAEAHKAIISVMEECGLKRLITLGTPSISAKEDVKQLVTVLPSIMPKLFFPTAYAEMKAIEKLLKNSKLDWTVIRIIDPNAKTNGNGYSVTFGDTKGKMSVSRYNVAKCMLEATMKDEWIYKMPIVFNN